jgi:hypothetical protein
MTKTSGHVLVNFALMLSVLLGMLALGIDGSYLFAARVAVRSAADLAALAGAWDLPGSPAAAESAALQLAEANGFKHGVGGNTVTATTPYNGDSGRIEVIIKYPAPTFFAAALAIYNVDVRGRAVAAIETSGGYAIYAGNITCPDSGNDNLIWSGSDVVATGWVHSNSGMTFSGQNNSFGETTYHCPGGASPGDNTFSSGPTETATKPYPVTYTTSQFEPCTYTRNPDFDVANDGPWWEGGTKASKRLLPGVYCSDGLLSMGEQGVTGTVTFMARRIQIGGSDINLRPFKNDVLLFSTDTSNANAAIKVSGSTGSIQGVLYAYGSEIEVAGSSGFSANVSIIGGRVKVSGSNWNLTGFGIGGATRPRILE